jgi:hypothetical protein
MEPPDPDFGSEADLVSSADEESIGARPKKWVYTLKGFLRAPMSVGIGPRNDGEPGDQLHSPPRIIGRQSDDWNYVGLAPAPTAQLHFNVANANVSGNVILAASTFFDAGYRDLDQIGGISQAYVTISSPELFGKRGGIAWNVGAFSNRYGVAGPNENSTGYFGTYLFGRTHVAGEELTADIDLTDDIELIVEHGIGAKLEFIPFIVLSHNPPPPRAPYLPDQGPVPQGSNFVHHAHVELVINDILQVTGHYMTSWTPNDGLIAGYTTTTPPGPPVSEGRLTVLGGEVHLDSPATGNAYVGYSHVDAKNLLPLADGIQVLYGSTGVSFKQNYFGRLATTSVNVTSGPIVAPGPIPDDTGTLDTVMGQYVLRLSSLLGTAADGPDAAIAVYGMINHVKYFKGDIGKDVTIDKYKFGGEIQITPVRLVSVGARFDRVSPDGHNADLAYSAISPRLIFHSNFLSREYVILNYTHYFLGSAISTTPYTWYDPTTYTPDPNLVTLSVAISF